jgi:HD-like signal output (HDOD) protein
MSLSVAVVEKKLNDEGIECLVRGIGIPPRPSLLIDLQAVICTEDPDFGRISKLVSRDVALAGAVIRTVNSPFFGASRAIQSIDQALTILGVTRVSAMIYGFLARQAVESTHMTLNRFWDASSKRSLAMAYMAKELRAGNPAWAQMLGLFCDLGIPLLMQRFPDYLDTLSLANTLPTSPFNEIEDARHNTNHASVGAILARTWRLSHEVVLAIHMHHDYRVLTDSDASLSIRRLVALALVAENIIQAHEAGHNRHVEWEKGGTLALQELGLSLDEFAVITRDVHALFNEEL